MTPYNAWAYRLRGWLLLVASWLAVAPAGAQEPASLAPPAAASAPEVDVERARALFKQGVELARARDFTGAAARFREALSLRSAPAVQYNLAAALSQLGEHAEAFNLCQQVLRDPEAPADVQEHSRKLADEVLARTARLTVLASAGGEAASIAVDAEPLPPELIGAVRAVTPGAHRITAERDGQRFFEREVSIPRGTAAIVDVSLIVTENVVVERQVVEVARAGDGVDRGPEARDATRRRRIRLWSAIAAGAVAAGAAVALGVVLGKPEPGTEAPIVGSLTPGVLTWK